MQYFNLTLMKGDSLIERLKKLTNPKLFRLTWYSDNLVFQIRFL